MSEDVFRRLREAIVSGELQPGERIRDYELAEKLGISKTPVRHALARLAELGLVEMQRNRYTRVSPLDLDRIRDAVALFGDIWIGSVRHAMPMLQADDIAYLLELMDDLSAAVRGHDIAALSGSLRAAAVGFARIEGNTTRVTMFEVLSPQIRRVAQHVGDAFDWPATEEASAGIREAIRRRDAAATREAIIVLFDDVLPTVIDRAEDALGREESHR